MKQSQRNRLRNKTRKSRVKSETRKLVEAIHRGDLTAAADQFRTVTKRLDQTAAKGTLHRKTAARRKSRLARRLNAALAAKSVSP